MKKLRKMMVRYVFMYSIIGLILLVFICLMQMSSPRTVISTYSVVRNEILNIQREFVENTPARCSQQFVEFVVNRIVTDPAYLRRRPGQVRPVRIKSNSTRELCRHYDAEGRLPRHAFLNVLSTPSHLYTNTLVTMSMQMSPDRLSSFAVIADNWRGPISVAVYLSDFQLKNFLASYCQYSSLKDRENILLHIVLKRQDEFFYPINFLRNVALNFTRSTYVFLNDADFVPIPSAEDVLERYFSNNIPEQKQALVVPAFEILNNFTKVPVSKNELQRKYTSGDLDIFEREMFAASHKPTQYDHWWTATDIYKIQWTDKFEPYLVIERGFIPPYNERFVGRYANKYSHTTELFAKGFEFFVAPDIFVVHVPHNREANFDKYQKYMRCALKSYQRFKMELETKYGVELPTTLRNVFSTPPGFENHSHSFFRNVAS